MLMFQKALCDKLEDEETVVADKGYIGGRILEKGSRSADDQNKFMLLHARHEIVNCRLKQFNVLGTKFR